MDPHHGPSPYCFGTGSEGGFNADGKKLLGQMDKVGMLLDVTHLADQSFWDAMEIYEGPCIASHHNCRAFVPGDRQLDDRQIMELIRRGSVIGAAFDNWMIRPGWKIGVSDPSTVTLNDIINHIDHICQLAGNACHSGLGTDLDGGFGKEQSPSDIDTIADLGRMGELLSKRGYSSDDVERVLCATSWIFSSERGDRCERKRIARCFERPSTDLIGEISLFSRQNDLHGVALSGGRRHDLQARFLIDLSTTLKDIPMQRSVFVKLSVMMFLQYFIWGAWFPPSFGFFGAGALEFSEWHQFFLNIAFPISAVIAMFFGNQFVDRNFSAEKFLAFSHFVGGIALLGFGLLSWREFAADGHSAGNYWLYFACMAIHCLFYVPTISVTNSIAFSSMNDPQKDFGPVRLWGTIGWIAAAWPFIFILADWSKIPAFGSVGFVQWLGAALGTPLTGVALNQGKSWAFMTAGIASLLLAAFSLTLPHTPPKRAIDEKHSLAWLEAMRLLKHPFLFVLFVVTYIDATVHDGFFYFAFTYLGKVGVPSNWIQPAMSVGQIAEIGTMAFLGYVLKSIGLALYDDSGHSWPYCPLRRFRLPSQSLLRGGRQYSAWNLLRIFLRNALHSCRRGVSERCANECSGIVQFSDPGNGTHHLTLPLARDRKALHFSRRCCELPNVAAVSRRGGTCRRGVTAFVLPSSEVQSRRASGGIAVPRSVSVFKISQRKRDFHGEGERAGRSIGGADVCHQFVTRGRDWCIDQGERDRQNFWDEVRDRGRSERFPR